MKRRVLAYCAFGFLASLPALAYMLGTEPTAEELRRLPIFTQTHAFTHGDYSNRMVRFCIYVREVGPLQKLRRKELLVARDELGKLVEGAIDYDSGSRQGVPSIDFVVDEACLPTSYLNLHVPHYQGGAQKYQINLKLLFEQNKSNELDGYMSSDNPNDETNPDFKEFMTRKYPPWNISVMKE